MGISSHNHFFKVSFVISSAPRPILFKTKIQNATCSESVTSSPTCGYYSDNNQQHSLVVYNSESGSLELGRWLLSRVDSGPVSLMK